VIERAAQDIKSWMTDHYLKLNDDKTEFLVVQRPHLRTSTPVHLPALLVNGVHIEPSTSVRNLGVIFNTAFNLDDHVNAVCRSMFYHLHKIGKIRDYLTDDAARALVQAYVISRLDYCNALFYGLTAAIRSRLQRAQNAAVRVVTRTKKRDSITPVLRKLHWLPVEHRVTYKIALMTFKVLHGLAPPYLEELVEVYVPGRALRSASERRLVMPRSRLQAYGGRAFCSGVPAVWNCLPPEIRNCGTLSTFKTYLKTHLFKRAFDL
jgi:hypothetical protein